MSTGSFRRHKVLYGAEVWVHPQSPAGRVIEFSQGQFVHAQHAHVYLCRDTKMADRVVEVIAPLSAEFTEKDARGPARE